jgi:hypothetical protein
MRSRASYTEMPFMIESGRARYTYSNEQGTSFGSRRALLRVQVALEVDEHGPPGSTSRTTSKPPFSSTSDSDATIHS